VNRIVSIYSFSVCLLLVYRKANDFCELIFYPATLLWMFMVSKSFGVEFFGSLRYRRIFCSGALVIIYYFSFCLSWKTFIVLCILNDSFAG
jgi:hypothetical protein